MWISSHCVTELKLSSRCLCRARRTAASAWAHSDSTHCAKHHKICLIISNYLQKVQEIHETQTGPNFRSDVIKRAQNRNLLQGLCPGVSLKSFVNTLQILKVLKLPKMLNIIAFKVLSKKHSMCKESVKEAFNKAKLTLLL